MQCTNQIEHLLQGHFVDRHETVQIPEIIPKLVRIFLSSTFTGNLND